MASPPRLLSHFAARNDSAAQKSGWVELWESDESSLWDRGTPSAALIDWIESSPEQLTWPADGRRPTALVPGCGKGYDVVMLALHGFDAVGLELSPKGAERARTYAAQELAEPHDYNFGSASAAPVDGPGSVSIVAGDFFDRSLVSTKFDIIYDYTFLCALHPDMRQDWARRMRELLAPTGVLVCLEFPLFKGLDELGPPWPLQGVYWKLLAEGGPDDGAASLTMEPDLARSLVRAAYFKPARSYPNGKGTDMVSIWRWKDAESS